MKRLIAGILVTLLASFAVAAQDLLPQALPGGEESADVIDPVSQTEIARRVAELDAQLSALPPQIQQADSASAEYLLGVAEKLEQIGLHLKAQTDLAEILALQDGETRADSPDDEASVYLLNALYDQLDIAESALREKRSKLDAAKDRQKSLETLARDAKAALEQSSVTDRVGKERALQIARLNARLNWEQLNVATLELRAAQKEVARDGSIEKRITALRDRLALGEGEVNSTIAPLDEREATLQRTESRATQELALAELRLAAAKKRYADDPQVWGGSLAVVEALSSYRDIIGRQISLANSELERLGSLRDIWRNWESLLRSTYTQEQLRLWEEQARAQLAEIKTTEAALRSQLSDLQIRRESLQARIDPLPPESEARAALQKTKQALDQYHTELLTGDRLLAADRRLTRRFFDDIVEITGNVSFLEYAARAAQAVRTLWTYEITTIDDAPFTIGSLTMGFLLFGVGFWASRLGAKALGRIAEQRLNLDMGAAHAVQTFTFYALLAVFSLLALRAVHFPLTAFAFLGGALAIGIGFGSQNVMNNFISGLILMLERPVRAQDVVEIDGANGVIQRIGPRSTEIRATDGRHIVVPNSFFLESNVINWTLSDDMIRAKVSVGVSYGSPTRLVKQLIEEVVRAEPLVLKTPAANVIFDAFADNSLNFDVYFWVRSRSPMGVRDVQSRIRFRIDDIFRENNLVIAFPQRDVHLDSTTPLDVRLVSAGETVEDPDSSTRES